MPFETDGAGFFVFSFQVFQKTVAGFDRHLAGATHKCMAKAAALRPIAWMDGSHFW